MIHIVIQLIHGVVKKLIKAFLFKNIMIDSFDSDLIYHNECITSFLCDDIIELSKIEENKEFIIPKGHKEWVEIEKMLYKELLTHLNHYKNKLISLNSHQGNKIIEELTKKLYTKDFKITITKSLNRFNIISYFFCLYDTITIDNKKFENVKGKLFLFPEEYKINNIGIYGQLCYENVV
jgi:hypothetical protein